MILCFFANNTSLFCSDNNIRALLGTVNQELSQGNNWFLVNKLSLNVEKTIYITDKLTNQENIPLKLLSLQLNRNNIEGENCLKSLDVILDEHLFSWKKDIQLIENKVSKNVRVFYKTSKLINSKCLRSMYFSFIHSYINYANIAKLKN